MHSSETPSSKNPSSQMQSEPNIVLCLSAPHSVQVSFASHFPVLLFFRKLETFNRKGKKNGLTRSSGRVCILQIRHHQRRYPRKCILYYPHHKLDAFQRYNLCNLYQYYLPHIYQFYYIHIIYKIIFELPRVVAFLTYFCITFIIKKSIHAYTPIISFLTVISWIACSTFSSITSSASLSLTS